MKIRTHKVVASGVRTRVEVYVERISSDRVIKHETDSKAIRNGWCTHGNKKQSCVKFGCRPCCPPNVKMFSEMKKRKYFYAILVKLSFEDYYEAYPKVANNKGRVFLTMGNTHKLTRGINNSLVEELYQKGDQGFRVGGCLGCQYAKNGTCKLFMPPLEATGINVVEFAKDVFDIDIQWLDKSKEINQMVAVGGLYTDRAISTSNIKAVVEKVCKGE